MNWTKVKALMSKFLGPLRYPSVRVAVAAAVIAYLQAMDVSIAQETVDKWLAFAALIVTALAGGNGTPAKPGEVK